MNQLKKVRPKKERVETLKINGVRRIMAKGLGKKVVIGSAIAAAAGYVVGVLTAPKSGKQTRDDLKKAASKKVTEAEKQLKTLHTQLASEITKLNDKLHTLKGASKKKCEELITTSKEVQNKAKDMLSALHDGEVDNPALKSAIQDVKQASKSIKDYLKSK